MDIKHSYLPNDAERIRLIARERPMVLWHWRHRPYEVPAEGNKTKRIFDR